jgi:O-methyltransferase involved in polyketide biosynthesis
VTCINKVIKKFLELSASSDRQVISLGSGFDTLALRLYEQDHSKLRVYEIDFNKIIAHKAEILHSDEELKSVLASDDESFDGVETARVIDGEDCSIHKFGHLTLLGSDLRSSEVLLRLLTEAGVNPSLPTLILT